MPIRLAGTISLSILSPIMIALAGSQLLLSNAIWNILGSGFATPSSAEATIKLINFKIPLLARMLMRLPAKSFFST